MPGAFDSNAFSSDFDIDETTPVVSVGGGLTAILPRKIQKSFEIPIHATFKRAKGIDIALKIKVLRKVLLKFPITGTVDKDLTDILLIEDLLEIEEIAEVLEFYEQNS